MTTLSRFWRCSRCGWRYESPIAVMGVGCPRHKSGQVAMRAVDELDLEREDDDE